MHYQNLPGVGGGFGGGGGGGGGGAGLPISAVAGKTAPAPRAPWVAPGNYTVRLTVDGKTQTQPLVVKQDTRVKTPAVAMREVYALTDSMYFTRPLSGENSWDRSDIAVSKYDCTELSGRNNVRP